MSTRRALGKGIEALIPHRIDRGKEVLDIPLDSIVPSRYQPRKEFADEPFRQLVDSIKANGVIQPVLVTKGTDGWELVFGERRWRAARAAGLATIPAIVKETTPNEMLVMGLIENLQREDLNPMETADSLGMMVEELGVTQEEVAAKLSLSRPAVAHYLRLRTLPNEVTQAVRDERLSLGHAKVLAGLPDGAMIEAARKVVAKGLSVRETEALVRRLKEHPPEKKGVAKRPSWAGELEDEFRRRLGARVTVTPRGKGGEIKITCRTGEELDRLITILRSKGDSR